MLHKCVRCLCIYTAHMTLALQHFEHDKMITTCNGIRPYFVTSDDIINQTPGKFQLHKSPAAPPDTTEISFHGNTANKEPVDEQDEHKA